MRLPLGDTLTRLKQFSTMPSFPGLGAEGTNRLARFDEFGSNPGELDAWTLMPEGLKQPALVVVLHGCTQTAAGYDLGSGWSELADRFGFAVLFAEQRTANNANRCFNWFRSADVRRGRGEASSIAQMTLAAIERFDIDPKRVFVTGLSAGGAMTSAMLATYPEIFAGGAIIAGLPFGTADSVPEAFERMRGQGHEPDARAAARVRRASDYSGQWPTVSVWQGTADHTVAPVNADAIVGQWRSLHGVAVAPDEEGEIDGFPHRVWRDKSGRVAIEEYRITGMGHGTPIAPGEEDGVGAALPHMLNVGISSTWRIAEQWGLLGHARPRPRAVPTSESAAETVSANPVQATIEAALRSAGLMK